MRAVARFAAVLVWTVLLLPSSRVRSGIHHRRGARHIGRRASRCDSRGRQPRPHRKGPHRRHRRQRPVPDRRSSARRLHRHVHAARLQYGQARRRRAQRRAATSPWTPSCASVAGRDDYGDRRSADRRHESLTKQQVLNSELVDALPSARNYFTLARMVPGNAAARRQRRRRIADPGRWRQPHGPRQPDRRSARDGQRHQHDDPPGRGQHRWPDPGHRFRCRGHDRHVLASARSADRRRAHQLHPPGRRQQVHQLAPSSTSPTRACRGTTSPTS